MSQRDLRPGGVVDELWRSALSVLSSMVVIFIAWKLIQSFIGPLLILVIVLGIIRLAFGFRARRW